MWVDVQQNTEEWDKLRVGRIGGSSIGSIMANYGKAFGNPAHDIAVRVALEKLREQSYKSTYSNAHMERGLEQEPIARKLYEDTVFCDVGNGGFFILNDDVGVSPDGLVYEEGLVEIKCVIDTVHYKTIKRNKFDPKYKWQLALNLKVSGREWIDYVEYCSDFPEESRLFIDRNTREDFTDAFEMIDTRLSEFKELVEKKTNTIRRSHGRH